MRPATGHRLPPALLGPPAAAMLLTGCATARLHSDAELNATALTCGLSYGELIQDAEAKKLLILFREKPGPEKRACVYRWARKQHLKLVVIDSITFRED